MKNLKIRIWVKPEKKFYFMNIEELLNETFSKWEMSELETQVFTGLSDRQGKEIYEGDILRRPAKDAWEKENYGCYEVFFHDGNEAGEHIGFVMNRSHYHGNMSGGCIPGFLPRQTEKMEVIGNIWEDAKLLTEVNK